MTWRVGTKLGRTLYRDEALVGMVDTPEIAAEIVDALNREQRLDECERAITALSKLVHEIDRRTIGMAK